MYIDAKQIGKKIYISEKQTDGSVRVRTVVPDYYGFYEDPDGEFTAITGEALSLFVADSYWGLKEQREIYNNQGLKTFESDISPVWKALEDMYPTDDSPDLNISIFDIETDKGERGYSSVEDPYTEITANSIYNKWNDAAFTFVLPPDHLTIDQCERLLRGEISQDENGMIVDVPPTDEFGVMTEDDGYYVVETEAEILELSLQVFEDSDVVSGWNSAKYDIPYFIHRIRIVLGGESIKKIAVELGDKEHPVKPSSASDTWLGKLNRFPVTPTLRMVNSYGNLVKTYALHGRIHMDYLEAYKKFTFGEKPSYKLDNILHEEIDQRKVAYTGDLAELRSLDFRKFVAYSRQDTMGLSGLDDKLKFINLANSMAHASSVLLPETMGTIQAVEGALIKALHRTRDHKIFDNTHEESEYPIPGAMVLLPKGKLHTTYLASFDYNSLYPNVMMFNNLGHEAIVGFLTPTKTVDEIISLMVGTPTKKGLSGADAWATFGNGTYEYQKVINRTDDLLEFVNPITGKSEHIIAHELADKILANNWIITGFGLVLHREVQALVPMMLETWYNERVDLKAKASVLYKKSKACKDKDEAKALMKESEFYNMAQNLRKLFLNSTYGCMLAVASRFFLVPIGASVTMSGKICLGTMVDAINEKLTSGKRIDGT